MIKFLLQFVMVWLGILICLGAFLYVYGWWQFDASLLSGTLAITGWEAFMVTWHYRFGPVFSHESSG